MFLEDLRTEGKLDSRGKFTVDFNHAREKLAMFLLEKTEHVLLKLVQAGTAAGARSLALTSKSTHISFAMNGVAFRATDLRQILNCLWMDTDESPNRALRHLAIAVNTAVRTRPTAIALATWDGSRGSLIRWTARGCETQDWKPPKAHEPVTLFQLNRTTEEYENNLWHLLSQRDILSMLFGTRGGWDPDRLMVADMARWCPIPLSLNSHKLEDPYLFCGVERITHKPARVAHKYEYRLPLASGSRGVRTPGRAVKPWPGHDFPGPQPGGILSAGKTPAGIDIYSQLDLVVDGIVVRTCSVGGLQSETGMFLRGVLAVEDCPTDLAGLQVIAGDPLHQKLKHVLNVAGELFPMAGLGHARNLYVDLRGV